MSQEKDTCNPSTQITRFFIMDGIHTTELSVKDIEWIEIPITNTEDIDSRVEFILKPPTENILKKLFK